MRRLVLLLSVACGTTADGVTQDAVPSLGDLKERVDQEPRNAAAVRALARLHLERGETDQALALATRLLDLSQDEPADRLLLARASLAESQRVAGQALGRGYVQSLLMDAEQSARLAARSEALRDEAELFLAHVLLRRDERSEALTLLSQLLERAPDLVDALALRGYLRLTGDTPVEALTDLERVLELAPDRDDVRKHRVLALSHRSLAEAEQALMGLVERGAMDLGAMVFEVLGTVPERAVRVLDALSRQQPADSGAWFFRGRAQALAGRFEDAVQSYERTLEIAPGDSSTLAHRADARGRAGDHEGLIEDLILVLRSGSSDAAWAERRLLSIAPWQAEQGEWEQLARVSSELVEQAGSVAAYGNLALSLRWLDQIEASEETYRDALDRFPNEASLINDYGLMLEGVGRLEEAAQCFGQAADLGSLDGLENLGILRLRQADVSGARAAFHTVLQQEPERLRSLAGYADVMLRSISSSR